MEETAEPNGRSVDRFWLSSRRVRPVNSSILPDFGPGEELPEWLLDEILLRLPMKSAFRLKCVSRRWLLELSHPSFRRRFLMLTDGALPSWTLLYGYTRVPEDIPEGTGFDCGSDGDCPLPRFTVMPSHSSLGTFQILGSSNGLLLCCQSWKDIYYIYDPLTLQCLAIPRGISWVEPTSEGLITEIEEGELKGYKVVRVGQELDNPAKLFVDVFSSELGLWTNYQFYSPRPTYFPKEFPYFRFARPVIVKETVYLPDYQEGVVIAYNPYTSPDQLSIVRLPDRQLDRLPPWFELCDVFRDKLRHYTVSEAWENPTLKVWELAEPSDGGQWSLVHSCRWSEIQWKDARLGGTEPHRRFLPLSFHPSDPNIVYVWNTKCVASYDMKARRLEVFCELDSSFRGLSWESVMPFVLPNWPVSIPRPTWKINDT
ncbi:F-box protein At3g26010-like [Punica granatum]|uniref:Uncharacterized protein n=2 Tax=Punica granatum TaxID=22663 RepID=A0A2I0LAT3_PUNGR|nr:F-box protein At3g26010-like [Punica granatum]PKI77795.1 hypothetical protein CRG98_001843 [Punica granatum]